MRGEHGLLGGEPVRCEGSSPHARGTRNGAGPPGMPFGIIPACAGNTESQSSSSSSARDHPRMRGEHLTVNHRAVIQRGSSPHARGTRGQGDAVQVAVGIIPACAGNTGTRNIFYKHRGDHPRMRGEHLLRICMRNAGRGSSPHARGTHGSIRGARRLLGIIPACAGNTQSRNVDISLRVDHPRMRGEHTASSRYMSRSAGSSPHARGTPSSPINARECIGIIPACAGNTKGTATKAGATRDHPRMRGEHLNQAQRTGLDPGSSPHARGTPIRLSIWVLV